MRVKTLMRTRFAVVSEETPLDEARAMLGRERFEAIPVVRAGTMVGLLRARELDRLGVSTVPSLATHDWAWRQERLTVRAVTSSDVTALAPEASVHDAISLMIDQDLDAAPVVDGSALVGLVARRDLLTMLLELLERDRQTGFEHIVVGVDFGPGTRGAVAAGLGLARQHGARLTLLHALSPARRSLLGEGVPRETLEWTRYQQREYCLGALSALVPSEPGVDLGRLVVAGDPAATISAVAARLEADLIVVGRSRRRLLGATVTDVLVERAPCPVLVVRPREEIAGEGRVDNARP